MQKVSAAMPCYCLMSYGLRARLELEIFFSPLLDEVLKKSKKRTTLGKDKRRKHRHWQVTVYYADGQRFARVYTDRAKAASFAHRQKRSPVVKSARVVQVS